MLQKLLDWSEVWALFIPLVACHLHPYQPRYFKPIVLYLWGALLLNLVSDVIGDFKGYFPEWPQSNLILYAIHSVFRFGCFVYFFTLLKQPHFVFFRNLVPLFYFLFVVVNFIFMENYFNKNQLSGNLFTIEAYFLLIYCIIYYLSQLQNDVENLQTEQAFWIVTGLSIYVVLNFFVFLFYVPMLRENDLLAEKMWSVHNVAYIVFCLFITKSIYVPARPAH